MVNAQVEKDRAVLVLIEAPEPVTAVATELLVPPEPASELAVPQSVLTPTAESVAVPDPAVAVAPKEVPAIHEPLLVSARSSQPGTDTPTTTDTSTNGTPLNAAQGIRGPTTDFTPGEYTPAPDTGGAGDLATHSPPAYVLNPPPAYPEQARRKGWEGTVTLLVSIDVRGKPQELKVNRSSGFGALDEAAVKAVSRWLFEPARVNGLGVSSQVEVPVRFSLRASVSRFAQRPGSTKRGDRLSAAK